MGRQNRRKPISLKNIEIIDTADKGKSVAKHDGMVIFLEGGVPGDICDITVFKRRKKFWKAHAIVFLFLKHFSLFSYYNLVDSQRFVLHYSLF